MRNQLYLAALLGLTLSSAQAAINAAELSQLTSQWASQQQSYDGMALKLGQGYDLFSSSGRSQCLDPEVGYEYVGSATGSLSVFTDHNFSQLLDRLGVNTSIEGGYDGFGGAASVEFAKEATTTNNSLSIVYLYKASTYPIQLKKQQTNHDINHYIYADTDGHFKAKDDIYDVCGNQFVSQLDLGASLRLNLRFEFSSNTAKQEVTTALGGQYLDIVKLKLAVEQLSASTKKQTKVAIFAQQVGGDVSQLGTWLGAEFAHCSMSDVNSCLTVLENFFVYQKEGFPKQLERDQAGKPTGYNWAVTQYHLKPFKDSLVTYTGPNNPSQFGVILAGNKDATVSPDVLSMRTKLVEKFAEQVEQRHTAELAASMNAGDLELGKRLTEVKQRLDDNIKQIQLAGKACFTQPLNCIEQGENAVSKLKNYDAEVLRLNPTISQGNIVDVTALTAWQQQNVNQNRMPENGPAYAYLPDFHEQGLMQQRIHVDANAKYSFYADVSVDTWAQQNGQATLSLVNGQDGQVLKQVTIPAEAARHKVALDYETGQAEEDVVLRLQSKGELLKVYRVYNTQLTS